DSVRGALPELQHVWQLAEGAISLLTEAGAGLDDAELARRRDAVHADDPATIIYTSGTTGRPKGCLLTHRNLLFATTTPVDTLESSSHDAAAPLLFLPLAHVFARVIQCGCVYRGVRLGYTADVKNLLADLGTFRPTFLLSVPRVFEKVYNG